MATVTEASPTGVAAAVDRRRSHLASVALAIGLTVCALYLVIPARYVFVRELLLYVGLEIGVLVLILEARLRVYRAAGLVLALGIGLWTIGDAIWGVYAVRGDVPFPSAADGFYLAGYVALAAALLVVTRRLFPEGDRGAWLEAALVTTVAGLFFWIYFIEPYTETWAAEGIGTSVLLVSTAYPLADLLLLAIAARVLVSGLYTVASFRWLAGALALTLVADVLFLLNELGYVALDDRYANTLFLLGTVLFAMVVLSPSNDALATRWPVAAPPPGLIRLGLIAATAMVPLCLFAVQAFRDESVHLGATLVASALLFTLALLRWSMVLSDSRQAAKREALLRAYAGELLTASGAQDLADIAERAAQRLVGHGTADVHSTDGGRDESAPGHLVAPVVVRGEVAAEVVADARLTVLSRVEDSVRTVADQLALALERERLLAAERETAEALAEQNERLRELDTMKDRFVSTVSHELRTPLTSMIGYLELVLDEEAGGLGEEQRQFLGIVSRNSHRLNALIDDILFVARVDAGRLSLDPHRVALAELADTAVQSARVTAARKGVDLRLEAEEELPEHWADPSRLTQLLDNLLSNAIKFTPEGGAVTVRVRRGADSLNLEVVDTGVGIPRGELGRLFERFFRATTGSAIQGTGLGLSIVQSIVDAHGGTISVESEVGVGTTFLVDLPLPGLPGAPETPAPAGTNPRR